MPSCSVVICKNRSVTKNYKSDGITYHRFPREPERKEKWIAATGRGPDYWPITSSVICSRHFEEKCFQHTNKSRRLFEWAVPTLRLRHVCISYPCTSSEKDVKEASPMEIENISELSHETETNKELHNDQEKGTLDNYNLNPAIEDTPRKRKLKLELGRCVNQIQMQKKQIKRLQKKTSRYQKKIAELKDIMKELQQKNYVNSDQATHLENLGANDLIRRYNENVTSETTSKARYSPGLRTFACTLHFYSPKAYEYVRKKFQTCLPHVRTIKKLYQSVDAKPGFTRESFEAIKLKVQTSGHQLLCNVVLDEMAIRQRVEWDGKQMHGYVDICNNKKHGDDLPEAKEALVFLVTAINSTWKIPVGYFLVDGVTGEQRANLVLQCLELLHDTGAQATSLTFDGCPANMTMAKELGCSFDTENLKTDFKHPCTQQPVFIFPDPCHMLKLLRNAFEANAMFLDENNKEIKWSHLKKLNQIQEEEKLHLANKLRKGHIYFKNQKMKVRLASQLFSNSVADALILCSQLNIQELENVEGTVQFLKTVNNLFDVFNSRHMAQLHFKKPLCAFNKDKIFEFLTETENYLKNLKLADGRNVTSSNRKTGFIGFLACIQSLKSLYTKLIEQEKVLKYLPTYKISQDHLELLFGHIRAHGGCNTNPTARQFQAIYKKLLVKSELRDFENGNCTSIEKISLLTCSSAVQNINITADPRLQDAHNDDDEISMLYEIALFEEEVASLVQDLSEFSLQAITYIAGFVVHALIKSLKCDTCSGALIAIGKDHKDYNFIKIKDKGGLMYPSEDVTRICKYTEAAIKATIISGNKLKINDKNILDKLKSKVMNQFIGVELFKDINFHQYEQSPLNNHLILLTKAVIEKYLKIRLHFLTKHAQPKLSKRQLLNKYLHFTGQ